MSEFTKDEYDIIMSEKPKTDIHKAYKAFFNMKLRVKCSRNR